MEKPFTKAICKNCGCLFFYKFKKGPYKRYCTRACSQAAYRKRHPDRCLLKSRNRARMYPKKVMLRAAKWNAKRANVPFNLTTEDFHIPELCPILGIKLRRGERRNNDSSPSLDRIIPALGYVSGNVWVISLRANRIKNDATLEELRLITAALEEKLGED